MLILLDKIWTLMWPRPGRVGGDEFECERRGLLTFFFQWLCLYSLLLDNELCSVQGSPRVQKWGE